MQPYGYGTLQPYNAYGSQQWESHSPAYPWNFIYPQPPYPPTQFSYNDPIVQFQTPPTSISSGTSHPVNPYPGTPPFTVPMCSSTEKPFIVKILTKRIKKCICCGSEFTKKIDGSLPDPPNDLVVAREERRVFQYAQNTPQLSRFQNVHYHTNLGCIRRRNPLFVSTCLVIPADITLLPVHHKYIQDHFGIVRGQSY